MTDPRLETALHALERAEVGPEDLPAVLGRLECLKADLLARRAGPSLASTPPALPDGEDELLDAEQAGEILCQSTRWVRKHAAQLPRVPVPGSRLLRFSRRRLLASIKRWSYSS